MLRRTVTGARVALILFLLLATVVYFRSNPVPAIVERSSVESSTVPSTTHSADLGDPTFSPRLSSVVDGKDYIMRATTKPDDIVLGQSLDARPNHPVKPITALAAPHQGTSSNASTLAKHPQLAECQPLLDNTDSDFKTFDLVQAVERNPVALFGSTACPCTSIAWQRLADNNVCFFHYVWNASKGPVGSFLSCLYGKRHSFVMVDHRFVDDGFGFAPPPGKHSMGSAELDALLESATALRNCSEGPPPSLQHRRKKTRDIQEPVTSDG